MTKGNKTQIVVKERIINILNNNGVQYLSLTDLARYKNSDEPGEVIIKWMSNKSSFDYYSLWEELFNENFKVAEFSHFKNDSSNQSFTMSPSRWIKETNAIGFISKRGKYDGGTFAHPDIAFEFASWLSPEFKLYLIKEFERLKKMEYHQNNLEWNICRTLSKVNYIIHTSAINDYIIPNLTEEQKKTIYAGEADVINVALFGMTAKEWRNNNPNLEGNIRDNTDIVHLLLLNNLENSNSEFIKLGLSQRERLIRLNESAKYQLNVLKNNELINQNLIDNN